MLVGERQLGERSDGTGGCPECQSPGNFAAQTEAGTGPPPIGRGCGILTAESRRTGPRIGQKTYLGLANPERRGAISRFTVAQLFQCSKTLDTVSAGLLASHGLQVCGELEKVTLTSQECMPGRYLYFAYPRPVLSQIVRVHIIHGRLNTNTTRGENNKACYAFSRSSCQTFFSCFKLRCTHTVVIAALTAAQANGTVQPICPMLARLFKQDKALAGRTT